MKHQLLAIFVAMLIAMPGCGKRSPQPVAVQGRITFNQGDWPTGGTIYFVPIAAAEGFPKRPGTAEFDADGTFAAKTFTSADGLLPGEYRVHVACWAVPPTMANPVGKSYVPPKFQNPATSGLKIVVKPEESSHEASFNVPKE